MLLQYRNIVFTIYHDIATIYRNTVMLFAYKSLNTKQILPISSFNSQKKKYFLINCMVENYRDNRIYDHAITARSNSNIAQHYFGKQCKQLSFFS